MLRGAIGHTTPRSHTLNIRVLSVFSRCHPHQIHTDQGKNIKNTHHSDRIIEAIQIFSTTFHNSLIFLHLINILYTKEEVAKG